MFDMRKHDSGCDYSDKILEYVYKELDSSEITRFEVHLESCSACPDEIAAFASVSGTIREWKNATFDKFESPGFIAQSSAPSVISTAKDPDHGSVFGRIREFFAASTSMWQTASAFAAILVAAGIIWIYFGGEQPAKLADKTPAPQPALQEPAGDKQLLAADKKSQSNSVSPDEDENPLSLTSKDHDAAPVIAGNKSPVLRNGRSTKKVKTVTITNRNPVRMPSKRNSPKVPAKVNPETSPPNFERLTDLATAEETEDDSLRLAELFAVADSDDR